MADSYTVTLTSGTFTLTRNPLVPSHDCAFGVLTDAMVWSVQAGTKSAPRTASSDEFLKAIRQQFPANATHPAFDNLTVIGVQEISVGSPNSLYSYKVNYAQTDSGGVPPDVSNTADLLETPPRVESVAWDFYQEPCERDTHGDPIINSAGDTENPAGSTERSRGVVTISFWAQGYDADNWKPFSGKLNSKPTVVPGLGLCDTRTARVLSIRPASGFNPYLTVPATITGSATHGDALSWNGGGVGYYGALATVGTQSAFTIVNPNLSVASGDTFTDDNTASTFAATATAAAVQVPVKVFAVIEWRETGFDTWDIDQGQRGAWKPSNTSASTLSQIFNKGALCGADIPLRGGVPSAALTDSATSQTYTSLPAPGTWDAATTNDHLAARVLAGTVNRTSNGMIDFVQFQRLDEIDFVGLPF